MEERTRETGFAFRNLGAGIGAAAGSLVVMFAGRFTLGTPAPPELFTEEIFAHVPMNLFSFFIHLLGMWAKWTAFAGVLALSLLGGGFLGCLFSPFLRLLRGRFHPLAAGLLYGSILWAVGMTFLLPLMGGGFWGNSLKVGPLAASLALWISGLAYGVLLSVFLRCGRRGRNRPGGENSVSSDRREFLSRASLALTALWIPSLVSAATVILRSGAARAQGLFDQIKGLSARVTPNSKFYRISKNLFDPTVDAGDWTLNIHGLVASPLTLKYDQLSSWTAAERYWTLECISNEVGGELISNARWKGIPLKTLVEQTRPRPEARYLIIRSADGYSTAVPLESALDPDALAAYQMNGVALPQIHGFPLRMLIPGRFGMKNPKWVTEMELSAENYLGFWESRGWSNEAVVKTMSRFDVPTDRDTLSAGQTYPLAGIAYAGDRGISKVEVSVDGGRSWQPMNLESPFSPYAWVRWARQWTPAVPGKYTLVVRATDGRGNLQTSQRVPTLPNGASGWHTITVQAK